MTIGIIGSGNVGGTLGTRWAKTGHNIVYGTRNLQAEDIQRLLTEAGGKARAATLQEAARAGEVLLLCTPWKVAQSVLESLGDLTGKVLIDATNPLLPDLSRLGYRPCNLGGRKSRRVGARREGCESLQHNRRQHHGEPIVRIGAAGVVLLR